MKRPLQFRIGHLIALVTLAALGLGYLGGTGFFFRNGVWEVKAISTNEIWYHGEDPGTGEPWFGTDVEYLATCRDGDQTMDVYLGVYDALGGNDPPKLVLSVGDTFQFAQTKDQPGSIQLPGGELVVLTAATRSQ